MTAASPDLVRDFDQAMMQIYVQAKQQAASGGGYVARRGRRGVPSTSIPSTSRCGVGEEEFGGPRQGPRPGGRGGSAARPGATVASEPAAAVRGLTSLGRIPRHEGTARRSRRRGGARRLRRVG